MAQQTGATDGVQIDTIDNDGRRGDFGALGFSVDGDEFTLELGTQDPRRGPEEIVCEIGEKAINEYTLVETSGRSQSSSMSSLNHHDNLLFVVRDSNEWVCYDPQPTPRPTHDATDYVSTQVPGVSQTTVHRKQGGRGHESGYRRRWKVDRELVEAFDGVWMVEFRREKGGSDDGSYNRIKNASATNLSEAGE